LGTPRGSLIHGVRALDAAAPGLVVATVEAADADDELLVLEGPVVAVLELVWALAAAAIVAINRIESARFIVIRIPGWSFHGSLSGRRR
jgi:hypothetical protein